MSGKEPKRDLRDGMLERGPAGAGKITQQAGNLGADVRIPLESDTTDIVRPDSRPMAEGQNTHQ